MKFRASLKEEKLFLKQLTTPSAQKRLKVLVAASKKQLRLLQTLLRYFCRGEIPISAASLKKLWKSYPKKAALLLHEFDLISKKSLDHLLTVFKKVHVLFPILLKCILKAPRKLPVV